MKNWKNLSVKKIKGEIWESIPSYEGIYEISSLGRVKRLVTKNCLKVRILRQTIAGRYCRVVLSKNAIKSQRAVHLLVAEVFIPNPLNLPIVCHNDDDPTNNAKSNLWRGTQSDNIKDCHKKGRAYANLPKLVGTNHPMYGKKVPYLVKKKMSDSKKKITDEQIKCAAEMYKGGESLRQSAIKNSISISYLSQLLNGGYKRL